MTRLLLALTLTLLLASGADAQKTSGLRGLDAIAAQLDSTTPGSPDPFRGYLLPGVTPDLTYWKARLQVDGRARGQTRALRGLRSAVTARYRERERARFNPNDDATTAEELDAFSTAEESTIEITGTLEPTGRQRGTLRAVSDEGEYVTEQGSQRWYPEFLRSTAQDSTDEVAARIGDGTFGETSGDVDIYRFDLSTPSYVELSVSTPNSDLDPVLMVYNEEGDPMIYEDDDESGTQDPSVGFYVPAPGSYYVFVWGYTTFDSDEPLALRHITDPSLGYGVGSTGSYTLSFASNAAPDTDAYSVELGVGDVLGVATKSESVRDLTILGPDGGVRMRSRGDISGNYAEGGPLTSPSELTGSGRGLSAAVVAPEAGTYTVIARGEGPYTLVVQGTRPGHERGAAPAPEVLFVDFDGGTFTPSQDIRGAADTTYLSPLRDFLPLWDLDASDEDAVIDAILGRLQRHLVDDLRADVPGMSGMDLKILNSRDHDDPGRVPGVNHLVIGGTQEQLGISGIYGIASTLDVGNYRRDDIGFVLLDAFSRPDGSPSSLNSIPIDSTRTMVELIGLGVGKTAIHEAGHFLGLWHTDNTNTTSNIQDEGGAGLVRSLGLGEDGVFGPGDGEGLRFREDRFETYYPVAGRQRAADALAHSLSIASGAAASAPVMTPEARLVSHRFSAAAVAAVTSHELAVRTLLDEPFTSGALKLNWPYSSLTGSRVLPSGDAVLVRAGAGRILRTKRVYASDAFAARADLRFEAGCETHGAGFSFGTENDFSKGIVDLAGTSWARITGTEWAKAAAARPGDWNTLELVVIGDAARLYLNGQLVRTSTVPVNPSNLVRMIVYGCSEQSMEYRFDNLAVVGLDFGGGAVRALGAAADASGASEEAAGTVPITRERATRGLLGREIGVRAVETGTPEARGYAFEFGRWRVRLTDAGAVWVQPPGDETWREAEPGEVQGLLNASAPNVVSEAPVTGTEAARALDALRRAAE